MISGVRDDMDKLAMEDIQTQKQQMFEPLLQQHKKAIFLTAVLKRGVSSATVAQVLDISKSTAYRWLRLFHYGDDWSLLDKRYGPQSEMSIRKQRNTKSSKDDEQIKLELEHE